MTTSDVAARRMPRNTPLRDFTANQGQAGIASDVHGQSDETPPNYPQGDPLDCFAPRFVPVMVKPPEQRHPGCHFDNAVETEANERYRPGDQSGDD
jgi:hypothetical protein